MSQMVFPRPPCAVGGRTFALVASRFNAQYVQGLVDHARDELRAIDSSATIVLHQAPGAFEIPIIVRELALRGKVAVILAFGVIIRGDTSHAEHLARSVTDGLQRIALETGVPVIHGVLSVENEEQARERCLGDALNRGLEAARAAVAIADALAQVRAS
jgi:6,7-dimethyl-8-ribityllumazine synthase